MAASAPRGARLRVLESLRQAIITSEYPPGTSLSEGILAETYGTSRTPIREALQQLQSEGLVEVVPRVGTFVREPSRRELGELFQLKAVLEGLGAQLLAQRGRVPEIDQLDANIQASEEAVSDGDIDGYAQLVHDFHTLIIEGADNMRLAAHYQTLMNQLAYHRIVMTTLRHPGRLRGSLDEHRTVLERIREKDSFGAEDAMRDHVRSSEREAMVNRGINGTKTTVD
jgi:DNA-binding GntR family transcriptional regulator